MKILLVNWQDRLNPMAGGAETHLHEIFGRLAARNHRVTLLASGWPGAPPRERVDGLDVRRVGRRYTFGAHAPRAGRRLCEGERFDVVVEALNKVPTFAPTWSGLRSVAIVHHLFGLSAFQEAGIPLASATWLMERAIPRFYRGIPVQAISESTADDLVHRGLRRDDIQVIHPGVDLEFFTPCRAAPREETPTFVYVGRLRRYKRVDLILRAFARLRATHEARLIVAGRGDWDPHLRRLARRLGISEHVAFEGFVSEDQKRDLLRRAWANVFVSPKEGWGITNVEAAACGTPTIASDAPGLRESVADGFSGLLVPHGDEVSLAGAMARLAGDRALVETFGRNAVGFAQRFSWDAAADATEEHLLRVVGTGAISRIGDPAPAHGGN